MEQFRAYSPEDIILSNLAEASARHTGIFEQELAHLAELARELTQSQADDEELISALPDLRIPDGELPPHLAQSHEILAKLGTIHSAQTHVLLCKEMQKLLHDGLFPDLTENALQENVRIVYQKSTFADTAFLQFSDFLHSPRAVYASSFPAACEDVYNDVCDFCILPVENTTEGRLVGFTKLIDRFGLKIRATCEVKGADTAKSTRFALLAKHVAWNRGAAEDQFLEIAFSSSTRTTVSQILLAADLCDLTLCKLDSIPQEDRSILFHAVLQAPQQSLPAFLLYLAMEAPQHTIVGIYQHLKLNKK